MFFVIKEVLYSKTLYLFPSLQVFHNFPFQYNRGNGFLYASSVRDLLKFLVLKKTSVAS